jgi:hypothetical protein
VNCVCGCGRRLSRDRGQIELNLLAGEVAIELVVWDKARALRSPVAADEVDELLGDGAPHYQQLLAAIHAGEGPREAELHGAQEWMERSKAARRRLGGQLPVPKRKVDLSADEQARIDRAHPERTFTGGGGPERPGGDAELEALLATALEDVRSGRIEEAEAALRRFLAERG